MSDPRTSPLAGDILGQLFGSKPPESAQDMRALLEGFSGLINAELPSVGALHEKVPLREIDGQAVSADVVVPKGEGPHPVLVYLHGGGWICGSPATHRKLAYRFAEAGFLVVNVDYRLAPEAPFPAAFDDCVFAVHWAARQAARFGGDASRLAIGGDSAGGNLSAAVAAALADDPEAPQIGAVLLLYGVFDFATLDGSVAALPGFAGPLAEAGKKMVELMVGSYLGKEPSAERLSDPRVSPIHAAHKLPPCHVMVGGADPLLAQAQALADALERAGTQHEHVVIEGMPHGFAQMEFFPQARQSIAGMLAFLQQHLG